jgi:thiol-disulfide isomerase/thioredoxin
MNSILRLRQDDFEVNSGTKGPVLCNGIKGLALVMFYSPMCEICKILLPQFKHLPQIINGCKFCILNINENKGILALSQQTIAPIEVVPYIVLYINGRPFLQYDDDATLERLVLFTQYSMKLVDSKKSFIEKGVKVDSEIPKYSIAKPYAEFKCEGDFCYLTYESAYKQKAPSGVSAPGGILEPSSDQFFRRS